MNKILLIFLLVSNIIILYCEDFDEDYENFEDYGEYEKYEYNDDFVNKDNIDIISISYELVYNNASVVKVIVKTYNEILEDINFSAFLKSEEEGKQYLLNCTNTYYETIECYSGRDISLNTGDKFYFYYEKGKNQNLTFDEKDILEDDQRISLIFKPEIPSNQKMFKDNRIIEVKINHEIVNSGFLYIVRKSKNILHKPKDGFNKYIELNNFISHAGLLGYRPQSTLIAFEEAIRRGYHIVDADLQFSKDKVPIIYHGSKLEENSNGNGEISSKTLKELKKLDFGSKFNEKYKGEKILTFEKLLKLCKDNNVIIDLDLTHLTFKKYFNDTDEYIKIIVDLIEEYDMINSILLNDARPKVILKIKKIRNDISFSLKGMNEKQNMEKIKDEYKGSKRLIYNIGGLLHGKTIDEETVKYGISLGKKIKASQVDDINFADKIQSWGVNYITTNYLHPFLIKNDKEDPIIVRCSISVDNEHESECEIDDKVKLIDNEIYNIYYSENIYNISEDINEIPIGEFTYVDTNILEELYYSIYYFNFEEGIIKLNTSNKVEKGEQIMGIVGPAYDNVAECYQYNFICEGNNTNTVLCKIQKDDENKVEFKGNYTIYSVEGYSLNEEEIYKRMNSQKLKGRIYFYVLVGVFVLIIFIIIICLCRNKKSDNFSEIKISGNAYISDSNLYR